MRVDALDQDDLDALYADLTAKGLKGNTIRHVHSLMSTSLQFGLKKKLVSGRVNVASLASPPPAIDAEVVPPTPDQVRAMIARAENLDPAFATLVRVTALTGLRRGEVCGLRSSDIDGDTLTVSQSVYETHQGTLGVKEPKTRQKRRVSLDEVAVEALRRHRDAVDALANNLGLDVPDDAYVFSQSPQGSEPMRPGAVSERYARLAKAVGANSTRFHSLRHFHATSAIAKGYDVVTLSKRLGHRDPSITLKIYAHAFEQRDRELAAATGAELSLAG
jgi:integrase